MEPRTFIVTFEVETDRKGGFETAKELADRISDALDDMPESPSFGFTGVQVTEKERD